MQWEHVSNNLLNLLKQQSLKFMEALDHPGSGLSQNIKNFSFQVHFF